jgi:hypothetical protein
MRYRKTAAGQAVVANRSQELDQKLRSLLVVINPSLIEAKIEQMVTALRLPVDALQSLLQRGLIEPMPGVEPAAPASSDAADQPVVQEAIPSGNELSAAEFERFRSAVGLISDIASRHLGWRAFTFQLKIERASSVEDIRPLAADLKELLRKVKKESDAAAEVATLDLLLS